MELNPKQKRFCEEYVIDFNATQAAIRSGYSKKTAGQIGEQILKKLEIQNYIATLKDELSETCGITKQMLIDELKKTAFFDIRKIYSVDGGLKNIHDFGDDEAGAIAGIETYDNVEPDSGMILGTTKKVKVNNKIQAIERISKMLGYDAPEKREIDLNVSEIKHNVSFK